jgi:hypothetical protein
LVAVCHSILARWRNYISQLLNVMWSWTFGFHKIWEISWLAANRLASQEGLFSME